MNTAPRRWLLPAAAVGLLAVVVGDALWATAQHRTGGPAGRSVAPSAGLSVPLVSAPGVGVSQTTTTTIAPQTSLANLAPATVTPTSPTVTPASTTVTPASTTATPASPPSLSTVSPVPLPSGNGWTAVADVGRVPAVWTATDHPLAARPDVVAAYATFDPRRLHAALFNGTDLPGGGPWTNANKVPVSATTALVAAFNGGFRFKHIKGGYFTEGVTVKPLLDGDATLAVSTSGQLTIGVYGRDLTNDGSWVSLRQNLPMVVDHGRESVLSAHEPGGAIYWGDDYGHVLLDFRSAVCTRADGTMMYVAVGKVDINDLATVLVGAGCQEAMQLDINGTWPQFVTFANPTGAAPNPSLLDPRMGHATRYIDGSSKDFIALFDPAQLPAGAVR